VTLVFRVHKDFRVIKVTLEFRVHRVYEEQLVFRALRGLKE